MYKVEIKIHNSNSQKGYNIEGIYSFENLNWYPKIEISILQRYLEQNFRFQTKPLMYDKDYNN